MALDFLGEAFKGVLAGAKEAIPAVLAIREGRRRRAPTAAETQTSQLLAQQDKIIQALQDPTSTIFKNIQAQERAGQAREFQTVLRDLMAANRRAAVMGRGQFFDPERRDEAMSRFATRFLQEVGPRSSQLATARLGDIASRYGSLASQKRGMIAPQIQRQEQDIQSRLATTRAGTAFMDKILGGIINKLPTGVPTGQRTGQPTGVPTGGVPQGMPPSPSAMNYARGLYNAYRY